MNSNNFFVRNKSILTFLILEVVALTAFNFGNVSYIFGIAGALLAVFAAFFVYEIDGKNKSSLWLLLPVGILLTISILGSVNGLSKIFLPITNLSLAVSLPAFFALGFFLRKLNDVKPKVVLFVVGGGLAAVTLFGLVSTVVEYGVFYSLIYRSKPLYYFNGEPYNVTKEMFWLSGFEFTEVYTEYGALFAVLCASFAPALLFISPKEERNDFIISASIGAVGLITLIVIPSWKGLLVIALAAGFAFIYKFLVNHKNIQKIIGFSFIGLIGLGVLFFIVALINAANGFKFTGALERIFVNNGIMSKCKPVFEVMFMKYNNKSVNFFGLSHLETFKDYIFVDSGVFEVELLKEVGVFGALLFVAFILMMGYFVIRYLRKSSDSAQVKTTVVTLLLSFFMFETLFYSIYAGPHDDYSYLAFLKSPLLLVILFVLGFVFMPPAREEKKNA